MIEKLINNGKTNMYSQLDNGMQFRIDEINKVKVYFIAKICEREEMSKTLSKIIAAFDYFGKTLLVLSAASGSVSISSFPTVTCDSVGMV